MITKFGSLYAGHVDLPNEGFDGTPVNDRWLTEEHLNTVYDKALALAQTLDRNGYDIFWMAEHHFQREGYEVIPNILMMALHLAHLTKNIRIGCGFNIAPMWHPIRLAEDYAMADILTGGRVVFGVGRGYHTREVESFGAPMLDKDANRDLFEEQVEVLMKAFHEDKFSHQGKYYTLPPRVPYRGYELEDLTLVPRPIRRPVETWQPIVSAGQRALDFMAKHGIKGLIGGGAASGGANERTVAAWRDALRRHGREDAELGTDLLIGMTIHIADSEEQGIKEATPWFEENMKMFAPLGFIPGLSPDQIAATADPKKARTADLPTLRNGIRSGAWIVGPPELVTERLLELQDRFPALEMINVGHVVGTPQKPIVETLERFAKEVMPAFKAQAKAPVSAD